LNTSTQQCKKISSNTNGFGHGVFLFGKEIGITHGADI